MKRRDFLAAIAGGALSSAAPFAWAQLTQLARARGHIVVVGGGFAGATCARYLRMWGPQLEVTLVEPESRFLSCPMSNRVIAGNLSMRDITREFEPLERSGVRRVQDTAIALDPAKRELRLAQGAVLNYDRLIVAPGIDFSYESLPGFETEAAREAAPHAWRAGEQTFALRRRLQSLPAGGVVAMHIPRLGFRCPPGPYERACLVARMLQRINPRAKLLVFDANPDVVAKRELFRAVFAERYRNLLEYHPSADFEHIDVAAGRLTLGVQGPVEADLFNIIPPQRAGRFARAAGLANVESRWCGVDFRSYESTAMGRVHVIGDAIASAPGSPKSAHMANQQAKVCAAAVVALQARLAPIEQPVIANTCYSFVNESEAIHVAAVYRYDPQQGTLLAVPESGGLSPAPSAAEGLLAVAWIFNILNDTLG